VGESWGDYIVQHKQAPQEAITVATQLMGLLLNEVAGHTCGFWVYNSESCEPWHLIWFLLDFSRISYLIPFRTFYHHEPNQGELLSNFLVYKSEHITEKGRSCVIVGSCSALGFRDQRCSETPKFVTNRPYNRPAIPLTVTATFNILNYTRVYSKLQFDPGSLPSFFKYNVDEWISTNGNQYGSNW